MLPLGLERQALPRRARRAVLGQHRLRLRRGDRPGGARADARAALLHQLVVRASEGDRARGRGGVARSRRPEPRVLRLRRLRGRRVGLEARPPVLHRARREAGQPGVRSPRPGTTRSPPPAAARTATRRSPATSPTTARRWAPSRSTASPRSGCLSSRSCPRCATSTTRTATTVPPRRREEEFTQFLLDDLEQAILAMGPETVCLVHMEPVQNAGGCFTPPAGYWQGVRAICDQYDILLSADEVITGFGRLGYWFGSERYDIRPDIVTCAKGLSSSYGPIGAVIASDAVMEPFLDAHVDVLARRHVRRPPGDVRDRAEEHRDHEARGHRRARARHRGRVPGEARDAARPADRRRRPRHGLLLRDRARQGQGDAGRPSTTRSASRSSAATSRRRSSRPA